MAGGFCHRHDVVDLYRFGAKIACQPGPCHGLHLFGVADDSVDLIHCGKGLRLGLGCATGDDKFRVRVRASQFAYVLPGLAHRLGGDSTSVDDHCIVEARRGCQFFHRLCLVSVETTPVIGKDRRRHRLSRNAWVRTPSKTCAVGPAIQMPSSRQSIKSVPPSRSIWTLRPVNPRRTAATTVAQDDEPEARVIPVPRSQTRMRI
mmetsp:Transcript_28683/g.54158  ORF Transcript_28683/g.54158 Transcript_28683/m.54158 type:complete len:204 (+) Transcript_28683:916-1527(+)